MRRGDTYDQRSQIPWQPLEPTPYLVQTHIYQEDAIELPSQRLLWLLNGNYSETIDSSLPNKTMLYKAMIEMVTAQAYCSQINLISITLMSSRRKALITIKVPWFAPKCTQKNGKMQRPALRLANHPNLLATRLLREGAAKSLSTRISRLCQYHVRKQHRLLYLIESVTATSKRPTSARCLFRGRGLSLKVENKGGALQPISDFGPLNCREIDRIETKKMMLYMIVLVSVTSSLAQSNETEVFNERKVKGQQLVTETVVAKVIGGDGFSKDFLKKIQDENVPIVVDNATLIEGPNGTAALVTENVKTTITRITIPLSTSYMDSEWYRETLRKFLEKNRIVISNNTTEYAEDEELNTDLIILKLWAGATFRDNINTVFGTVLYNPRQILPGDLHSSLSAILDLVRLRRVPIIGFLDVLEAMSFANPHEQFKILFERLERHVPKYIKSSVTFWLENLHTNVVNMSEVMTGSGGAVLADFLMGIDNTALSTVRERVLFPKAMRTVPRSEMFGKLLSQVLAGISDGSLALSRHLFAGILLHLPLNRLTPQADESIRFFADSVKKGTIEDERLFAEAVKTLLPDDLSDPYRLAKEIFKRLTVKDLKTRSLYETILVHMEVATGTYAIRDFDVIAPILSSDNINIEILLSRIVPGEYPNDIVDAKDRLRYYISKNYIDFEFVLRGFIRHQQETYTDLLIAILTRIELRSQNLPRELSMTLTSLKTHIIYKEALNRLRLTLSVGDLTTLLLSYQSPILPPKLREVATDLRALLQVEFTDADQQLNKQFTAHCSRPRQCVVTILKYLIAKSEVRSKECEGKVREFLLTVNADGEPVTPEGNTCVYVPRSKDTPALGSRSGRPRNEIYPGKYSPSPYKNYNPSGRSYDKPIYMMKSDSGKITITGRNGDIFYSSTRPELTTIEFVKVPLPHPGWINDGSSRLLPDMTADDMSVMAPVQRVLGVDDVFRRLGVTPSRFATKGALLVDTLTRALEMGDAFPDEQEKKFVESYVKILNYAYEVLPPPPPPTARYFRHEVNLPTLFQSIPTPTDEDSLRKLEALKMFVSGVNLSNVTREIDPNNYPSKGGFLKRLFDVLLESGIIDNDEISNIIRYFQSKVMKSGYGAQPIDWVIVFSEHKSNPS